jgi:hypothetical protein
MRRREFIRGMVSAVAVPGLVLAQAPSPSPPLPAPVPWTKGLDAATPIPSTQLADVVAQAEPRFFTQAQMATLERLSDVLVPVLGDRPGALAAQTPAFLDFLIGGSPADRKQLYRGGLDWLDAEAKRRFSVPFARLDAAQADRILQPWMRAWMSDHPPTEPHADFVNIAHADIRNATVNSKVWSETPVGPGQESPREGLYWYPIEPDVDGQRLLGIRSLPQPGRPLR